MASYIEDVDGILRKVDTLKEAEQVISGDAVIDDIGFAILAMLHVIGFVPVMCPAKHIHFTQDNVMYVIDVSRYGNVNHRD